MVMCSAHYAYLDSMIPVRKHNIVWQKACIQTDVGVCSVKQVTLIAPMTIHNPREGRALTAVGRRFFQLVLPLMSSGFLMLRSALLALPTTSYSDIVTSRAAMSRQHVTHERNITGCAFNELQLSLRLQVFHSCLSSALKKTTGSKRPNTS